MQVIARVARSRWLGLALLAVTVVLAAAGPVLAQTEGAAGAESQDNLLIHIVKSAGIIFGPLIGLISVCLVALIVMLLLDLRMSTAIPPQFVEEFTDTVNKRQFKQAFDLARNDQSFLARVLTAGMSRLQYGLEDAREASVNMLETIKSSKEQLNNYTAVIGALGPLIGLVGTVFGMILAFRTLSASGVVDAKRLASDISHALVITLLGVFLALPAIFFNAFLRNRIIRISMDTGNIADDLLTQMYHNSKKPAPQSGPPVPAGPVTADARSVGPAVPGKPV